MGLPEDDKAEVQEYPLELRMEKEKEMLGMYFSAHPLDRVRWIIERVGALSTWQIKNPEESGQEVTDGYLNHGSQIILVGLLKGLRHMVVHKGKNTGRKMAVFLLEDFFGEIECIVFANAFEKNKEALTLPDDLVSNADANGEADRDLTTDGRVGIESEFADEEAGAPLPEYKIVVVRGTLMREIDRMNSVRATKITPVEKIEAFFIKQDAEKQAKEHREG